MTKKREKRGRLAFCANTGGAPPERGWQFATGGKKATEWQADAGATLHEFGVRDGMIDALISARSRGISAEIDARSSEADGRRAERERELQLELLAEADVICCQMISAGGDLLAGLGRFKGILIDEVAQASEPATIVPVSVARIRPS